MGQPAGLPNCVERTTRLCASTAAHPTLIRLWRFLTDRSAQAIEDDQIDVGELVAQHMYLHLYGLALQEEGEWSDDVPEGTVVFDSNPELD